MRIALATQEDPFYLPRALDAFCAARRGDVCALIKLPAFSENLLATAKRLFEFYGFVDFTRLAIRYTGAKAAGLMNGWRPWARPYSADDVARRHQIPLYEPAQINAPVFLEILREEIRPELIVSIAASQIFKANVLQVPRLGCINLHSAPLPRYQGMMPNFWTLVEGEPHATVTVHYMVEKLDAGDIILARPVPIYSTDSLHDLMVRSKEIGVETLLEAVRQIEHGTERRKPMESERATYFSFPKRADAQRLRQKGHRLL